MFLGYRLRILRKERNMSQAELGNLLGITKVSISGYENGSRFPCLRILNDILDIFDVSADYLLGREVNVVCEDDENANYVMSTEDINIINVLKNMPNTYSEVVSDPKRFFSSIGKKNI